MNKVILMGRLTRDPEIRYKQGDSTFTIARFSIAVDRRFKREGDAGTDFFNCTAFGKLGEFVERYLKKGVKILLIGRIQNDNYTNREGQKVYSVQVIADEIEFAESKRTSDENRANFQSDMPAPMEEDTFSPPDPSQAAADGFMNIPDSLDEELPFN